jgi:hypothetical protein
MAAWLGAVAFLASAIAAPPAIRWLTEPPGSAVEVDGIPADTHAGLERAMREGHGSRLLEVFAESIRSTVALDTKLPPVAGTWRLIDGRLRFEPQFPWAHGVRYRAEYRPEPGRKLTSFFVLPAAKAGPPTEVVQVFPSARVLPENQLKFYVQFSAAMSRGGTYGNVQVRDADGRVIDLPFLELDEELWDPAMTRLTLLIDPGRIKRGVKPLEDIGPVFEQGRRYSITVDAACRDAAGHPLRQGFEKTFTIGPADRTPPDPDRWTIRAPRVGTRDPLSVAFDEPMDQALALRLIRVLDAKKKAVEGEATLTREEREWQMVPAEAWRGGRYQLTVATTIEDLAGNNVGKTFDVDLNAGAQRRVSRESVTVSFEVK